MAAISEKIREHLASLTVDEVEFWQKGNASAARRARKTLQTIRQMCAKARVEIIEAKNSTSKKEA